VGSKSVRGGVAAVGISVLTVAAQACSSHYAPEQTTSSTVTSVGEQQPTARPSCPTAIPAAWQKAIDEGAVAKGGVSNVPGVVNRRGEVIVTRDNGDSRELLLIGTNQSVNRIYAVPEPDQNQVGSAAMDDRWVVVGLAHAPRHANGVLPTLVRIEVIDRQGGPVRTVTQSSAEDLRSGGKTIDSFALFGGKVYWITRDTYAGDSGTIRSFDLNTGAVTDVASGAMRNVRTTAAGLAWEVAWDPNTGPRAELKIPDELPPAVAGAVGAGRDQMTLATDGNAYAWFVENGRDTPDLAYWSPKSGHVRITGGMPPPLKFQPDPLFVVGPYVVIGTGRSDDTFATVVDSRSGALTYLHQSVGGANGGTIGVGFGATRNNLPSQAGAVHVDSLPQLSC
jgi:hypothetical protein